MQQLRFWHSCGWLVTMCTLHNYRYPGVCPRAPIFISITVTRTQIPDPLSPHCNCPLTEADKTETFAQMRSIVKLHSSYDPILGSILTKHLEVGRNGNRLQFLSKIQSVTCRMLIHNKLEFGMSDWTNSRFMFSDLEIESTQFYVSPSASPVKKMA